MTSPSHAALHGWLAQNADSLDQSATHAAQVVPALAAAGVLRAGVPVTLGGDGGDVRDGVEAIAAVAEHSLSAAFVFWGQRAFIEYLLQSPNTALRERHLAAVLSGECAGATGLSNAMKFLSGIESLQIDARPRDDGWTLDGRIPWATNLRKAGFVVAAAVSRADGQPPFIVALPHDRAGTTRSADLDLIALRGSNTAALTLETVHIDAQDLIHADARAFLPRVRPAFLGLQCGLSIGLARSALAVADQLGGTARPVLQEPLHAARRQLRVLTDALLEGLTDERFVAHPASLFQIRIGLAEVVQQAVSLELQASGGRAYHRDQPLHFARRWRESAFIPIVTPSLTQLQGELQKHAARAAAPAAAT
ncbi:acyl-CoA dehydrogenase family protein [Uliginosibacterium sp. H1]|uniref:acyl-CoA dehydrogenase family protein n=1 Tax=Uliginosibacterium sp. H1 TaxID=3114757 RepID=UPI002E1724FB|nr:acyl-CoA dehydrogenase family protein [Uliginosibacterium sp. H1]